MSGFTAEALLYPLTKGDTKGHAFHGNQYEQIAGGDKEAFTRPSVGKFQLSPDETKQIAKQLVKDVKAYGHDKAYDKANVAVAKMLGMDKPATKVDAIKGTPDLYRGCDLAGAKSLTEPLTMYGKSGGALYGNGIYTTPSEEVASQYVNNGGVMVKMSLDPNANLASDGDNKGDERFLDYNKSMSEYDNLTHGERDALDDYISHSANLALLTGSQGYAINSNKPESVVIFDRSVLKVAY